MKICKNFDQMGELESCVILKTKSKKEYKLPETSRIINTPRPFYIHPNQLYLTLINENVELFTLSPFVSVSSFNYKKAINEVIILGENIVFLTQDGLFTHSIKEYYEYFNNYERCSLIKLDHLGEDNIFGVQSLNELKIFDNKLNILGIHKSQCSYSIRDVLFTADFNILNVIVKNKNVANIKLPDYITSIAADPIFAYIYCATQDNNIYKISTSGETVAKLEYHSLQVKKIKLNFTGEYLYSCDEKNMCIWNTKESVVIGTFESDCEIYDFDLFIEGDRRYKTHPCFFKQ